LLVITTLDNNDHPDWDNLFKILIRSSPIGLFRFKFSYYYKFFNFKSLESFLDNWNGHPILLQTIPYCLLADFQQHQQQVNDLICKYITKGSVKAYDLGNKFEDGLKISLLHIFVNVVNDRLINILVNKSRIICNYYIFLVNKYYLLNIIY
jgi:hypothetical protein